MKSLGLDPKHYKHISSDEKSTTLQHKGGHLLTIAHNALSPRMQTQLRALANVSKDSQTPVQAQEAQVDNPKLARGGEVDRHNNEEGVHPRYKSEGTSEQGHHVRQAKTGALSDQPFHQTQAKKLSENNLETLKSSPKPNLQGLANGGMTPNNEPKATPTSMPNFDQGGTVWDSVKKFASDLNSDSMQAQTAALDAQKNRHYEDEPPKAVVNSKAVPAYKSGGPVARKMYADEDAPVSKEDNAPEEADPNQVMSPIQGPGKQMAPGVNININSGPQPATQAAPQPEAPKPEDKGWHLNTSGTLPALHEPFQPDKPAVDPNQQPQQPQQAGPPSQPDNTQQAQQPQQPSPAPITANPPQNIQPGFAPVQNPAQDPFTQARDSALHDMKQESDEWGHDLKNGHITPKTYESLFHDKSTLGKIGTIFGMLISGAGSGLAHQSNAMLDMMNKQIQNDLEAQTTSKTNAQHFLKLSQEHEMNKANVSNLNADTALKAKTLANIRMNQVALDRMVKQTEALPLGSPERAKAEQTLAMLNPVINNENLNLMSRAAIGSALYKTAFGNNPASGNDPEAQFETQQRGRMMLGPQGQQMAQFASERHLTGVPGEANQPIPPDTRKSIQAMNILDNKGKDVLNFVKKHSGTWNPQTRSVAEQKIEEMKNFYNDSIDGGALTKGRLGWYDDQFAKHPTDILEQLMGSTAKLEEMVNSNSNRRDLEIKNLGLDPKKRIDDSPVRIIRPDGRTGSIPASNLHKALQMGYKKAP
jgi:hypothetical protein